MLGLTLKNTADVLYTLTIAFSTGLFINALQNRNTNNRLTHHILRMGTIPILLLFQKIWINEASTFSIVFISEIFYLIITLIGDFFKYTSEAQKKYSSFAIALSIAFAMALKFTTLSELIYAFTTSHIAMAHIAVTLAFIAILYARKIELKNLMPFILNGIGTLSVLIILNLNGIFILLIFKVIFYIRLITILWEQAQDHVNALLSKSKRIEKSFDDAVRKEVNEKLFYMELSKEKMAKVARIDDMTGALNKKALINSMEKLITDKRTHVFSILMFDIDKFKTINDSLGHIVGDKCIKRLAMIARDSIRDHDELGRYGGDEFFILLPDADIRTAVVVSERFRQNVAKTEDPHFTISIGISSYPEDGNTVKALIAHADEGLYLSKENGRNKTSYKKK